MADYDSVMTDDERAQSALDIHYGMLLGCSPSDLRRPGWRLLSPRMDVDPMALLFGQRAVLNLVVPIAAPQPSPAPDTPGAIPLGDAGVAMADPSIRAPLANLLRDLTPADLFAPAGLRALDAIVRRHEQECFTSADDAYLRLRYTTPTSFRPYRGQWQEFIEPLDEGSETEPLALSLLARYSGGVYVIRQRGAIASFAGIMSQSPHVAEIGVRTDLVALRNHGLARAVVSRATRAIFAGERLPFYRHRANNYASQRVADALGYRLYGAAITYFAPPR